MHASHHNNQNKNANFYEPSELILSGETMKSAAESLNTASTKIMYCYPGGNDTHITVSQLISRDEYGRYDREIRGKYRYLEQGGFLEQALNPMACAHLQMAGGEFCGNALRSFGALLASDYARGRDLAHIANYTVIKQAGNKTVIPVTKPCASDF